MTQIELPADEFRDQRFIFIEANRMPKELRRRLSRDQLDHLPFREWSAAQPNVVNQNNGNKYSNKQTWKLEHLQQLHHRKAKIWSGSIAKRQQKPDYNRHSTALDISRSLGITTMKTSDDYYSVSNQNKGTEQETNQRSRTLIDIQSEMGLQISNSKSYCQRVWLPPAAGVSVVVTGKPLQLSRHWKSTSSSAKSSDDSSDQVTLRKLERGKAKLLEPSTTLDGNKGGYHEVPVAAVTRPYKQCGKERRQKTEASSGEQRVSSLSGRLPDMVYQPRQLIHQATAVKHRGVNPAEHESNYSQTVAEQTDVFIRKPVIPSLTHLTEVMSNCRAYQSGGVVVDDNRDAYESSLRAINKYHGSQIVVDSTEYESYARKQKRISKSERQGSFGGNFRF